MGKIRVLLADDHTILRQGLVDILKSYDDIIVVAEVENGGELIQKYEKVKPDIVLTDIEMPIVSGIVAAKQIIQKHPEAKILFLSMYTGEDYIYKIDSIGGKGLLSKEIIKDEFVYAIRSVFNGGTYYFGKNVEELEHILHRSKEIVNRRKNANTSLTIREHEILLEIAKGISSEEIASNLKMGKRTVDTFRSSIMSKLNIKSLSMLIKYAIHYSESSHN
ncbi:DNA-binding response regulator [bacterium]|nr:DNA-binding response regulator [bacterium]